MSDREQPPPLRALTLHRPWARCVAEWDKLVENRPWRPPRNLIGQYLAIHAGLKWDDDGAAFIRRLRPDVPLDGGSHPAGVIVAVCRVTGCCSVGALTGVTSWTDGGASTRKADGTEPVPWDRRAPWVFGPYAWMLEDMVAIPPVLARGAQGLWKVCTCGPIAVSHVQGCPLVEVRKRFRERSGMVSP